MYLSKQKSINIRIYAFSFAYLLVDGYLFIISIPDIKQNVPFFVMIKEAAPSANVNISVSCFFVNSFFQSVEKIVRSLMPDLASLQESLLSYFFTNFS